MCKFHWEDPLLLREKGEFGLLGSTIADYGSPGASCVTYGRIACEVERIDSGNRSMMSVQSSLSMYPTSAFGYEARKQRWLTGMTGGDGVSDEFSIIRHMLNLKVVNTDGGSHDVPTLILGRTHTGITAFAN
jgi:alkylation response protein AidB-like acyl-CoA dehydrogenase